MSKRKRQLGDLVQRSLGRFLAFELESAGIAALTVTGVDVSPDMRQAKIFFAPNFLSDTDMKEYLAQLDEIAPRLRHELSRSANLRHTPKLKFVLDHGFVTGEQVDKVMRNITVSDDSDGEL
jgi:ribosome-binding factor A